MDHQEPVVPRALYIVLMFYGIRLTNDYNLNFLVPNPEKFLKCLLLQGLKIVLINIPIILMITLTVIDVTDEIQDITAYLTWVLDLGALYIPLYLIMYRRKKLIFCIQELRNLSSSDFVLQKQKRCKASVILLFTGLTFSLTYIICAMILSANNTMNNTIDSPFEIFYEMLIYTNHIVACIVLYGGTSTFVALFFHVSMVVSNILFQIKEDMMQVTKNSEGIRRAVQKQRKIFSDLQKISSSLDSIFNDITMIWLTKVVVRCCIGAVDFLMRPWDRQVILLKLMNALDATFDISHLLILCYSGGRIQDGRRELIEFLTYFSGSETCRWDSMEQEFHFFVSLLGHSSIGFTAAKTFNLDRGLAVSILGTICSYYVLIYQFTPH